jgi:hypothetical protein
VCARFLSELERGKPTARLAETLRAVESLGLRLVIEDQYEIANSDQRVTT